MGNSIFEENYLYLLSSSIKTFARFSTSTIKNADKCVLKEKRKKRWLKRTQSKHRNPVNV